MSTIASISTAPGIGGIGIIRMSGENSFDVLEKIFVPKTKQNIEDISGYTIKYGNIVENGEIVDEVLVSYFKAPKSYTTENMCEINSHGGNVVVRKILELCLKNGANLAEPGEFTKRAFLNGRIDLTQADGIMNLIEAKTDISRKMSINQLNGQVSNNIKSLRTELVDIISNIEVNIDYPEYEDIEVITTEKIKPQLLSIKEKIINTIKKSEDGKIINEGIKIGIIGRPNVGKSSLLNTLLEEEKAIVTDIEGTTRDIVEGNIIINGIMCHIIDTAGIRETDNIVEQIGVNKSYDIINSSDLIIMILNNNEEITEEEEDLLKNIKNKNHIIVVNKIDLENKLKINEKNVIKISIKENIGIEEIKNKISEIFNLDKIKTNDMSYLSNARSISLLKQSLTKINECIENINNNVPIDIIELDIKECWNTLGQIIGETYTDELIDEIFSRFCLGK